MSSTIQSMTHGRRVALAAVLFSLSAVPLATGGQVASYGAAYAQSDDEAITVFGFSKPYQLDFVSLQSVIGAYEEAKPRFSPESELFFEVLPKNPDDKVSDISLELVPEQGDAIALPINAQGRFIMPKVDGSNWKLVANRGATPIAILPIVLSPNSTETNRRLGDLRAQFPAMVAIAGVSFSSSELAAFDAMGGCQGQSVNLFTRSRLPLASAWVEENGQKSELPIQPSKANDGATAYRMPLADKAWSNEARVHLVYAVPEATPAAPEPQTAPID